MWNEEQQDSIAGMEQRSRDLQGSGEAVLELVRIAQCLPRACASGPAPDALLQRPHRLQQMYLGFTTLEEGVYSSDRPPICQ